MPDPNDARDRLWPSQPDMQSHHRALAEADKKEAIAREGGFFEFVRNEGLESRCGCGGTGGTLGHREGLDWPPLVGGGHPRNLRRCVGRYECGMRERGLHHAGQRNQIVSVRSITMDQDDESVRLRPGEGGEAGTVERHAKSF